MGISVRKRGGFNIADRIIYGGLRQMMTTATGFI